MDPKQELRLFTENQVLKENHGSLRDRVDELERQAAEFRNPICVYCNVSIADHEMLGRIQSMTNSFTFYHMTCLWQRQVEDNKK